MTCSLCPLTPAQHGRALLQEDRAKNSGLPRPQSKAAYELQEGQGTCLFHHTQLYVAETIPGSHSLPETKFRSKITNRLNVKGMNHAHRNHKK